MQQLKLIWDFRGPDAKKIAAHHEVHLKQYIIIEKLQHNITGIEIINDLHVFAFLVVDKSEMLSVRDALKPHRGVVYNI